MFVGGNENAETEGPGQKGHQKQKATDGDILFDDGPVFAKHREVV
jgi:hypothetical protein